MGIENKKWILKERPSGLVKDSDFEMITETLLRFKMVKFYLKIFISHLIQLKEDGLMMYLDIFHLFKLVKSFDRVVWAEYLNLKIQILKSVI